MRATRLHLALIPFLVFSCAPIEEDGDSQGGLAVKNTGDAVLPGDTLHCDGVWLAYLASEQRNSEDLNGEGDMDDQVAILVDTSSGTRTNLGVACKSMAFLNETLFLVVDEAEDARDWDGEAPENTVLLFVNTASQAPEAKILPGHPANGLFAEASAQDVMAVVGESLLFCTSQTGGDGADTNLMYATVPSPGADPETMPDLLELNGASYGDGVYLSILEVVEGLAFLTMDESYGASKDGDSHNYNNDDDDDEEDESVLALWDGVSSQITPTFMAVDRYKQVDALRHPGLTEWTVAFLADEQAEGENLNGQPTHPGTCNGGSALDDDTEDHVLHWCLYTDLIAGPAKAKSINTGLVGGNTYSQAVCVMATGSEQKFVGCVSGEMDQGREGGCDMNDDGDKFDFVFRWVEATDPSESYQPEVNQNLLHAVASSFGAAVPGGAGGAVALNDFWVIMIDGVSDDQQHWPGTALAILDPGGQATEWTIYDPGEIPGEGAPGYSPSWVYRDPRSRDVFHSALTEIGMGEDRNADGDQQDSVPVRHFVDGEGLSAALKSNGIYAACNPSKAGIVEPFEEDLFFRLSEADQHKDCNDDGDIDDDVLFRGGTFVETHNSYDDPAVYFSDAGVISFGAFLFQENQVGESGLDKNSDGDSEDAVVHYFTLSAP